VSILNKLSKHEADVEDSAMSLISSSLGCIESKYEMANYRPPQEDFFFSYKKSGKNSASYEYKKTSANMGAQFVPMGIPTNRWKTCSSTSTNF
jgi:hypothetical protein